MCFEEGKKVDISILNKIMSINISHGILFLFGISTHANQWRPFLECAQLKHGKFEVNQILMLLLWLAKQFLLLCKNIVMCIIIEKGTKMPSLMFSNFLKTFQICLRIWRNFILICMHLALAW
jgi:hypothetical protein